METWQELASAELDVENIPHLRMSAAGHCPAALAYATLGLSETNPPDEESQNRMAMGNMAEILIIRGLESRGWETKHTVLDGGQLEVEITLTPEWSNAEPQTVTGHPDGICRHPEFTQGHWVTLECKSMSPDRAIEVEQFGVAAVYPSYIVQAALYGQRLYEMGEVVHPRRAVFGMMDREGRFIPPERVSWPEEVVPGTIDKLTYISFQTQQGEVPIPPYPQDSSECRTCNYYNRCWKGPPDFGGKKRPGFVRVDDPSEGSGTLPECYGREA